jgi:hypothetical protein
MAPLPPDTVVPYITTISQVREVTLLGSADLTFWQDHLAHEGLAPTPANGRAQLIVSAPDLRWSGMRFHELSLGVIVGQPPAGTPPAGLYLAYAANSSRLLAFLERRLFHTPYEYQAVCVDATHPASISLTTRAGVSVRAAMAASATPLWSRDDTWEGSIFLPTPPVRRARCRWFRARLGGLTLAYAFNPAADTLTLNPAGGAGVPQLLIDSQFTPEEWRLRAHATHARSRTYAWQGGQ